jgi:hypothetical protein
MRLKTARLSMHCLGAHFSKDERGKKAENEKIEKNRMKG